MSRVNMLPEAEPRTRFLSEEEKKRLFAAIDSDKRLMAIVLIGLLTGWRKDQILGIRKRHLDTENIAVTIEPVCSLMGNHFYLNNGLHN